MNLVRQPLFKDAHKFFRSRRGQLSNTYTIQHNRGDIICKRSMSSKPKKKARPLKQILEAVGSDLSELTPDGILDLRYSTKRSVENLIRKKFDKGRFSVEFFGSVHYGVAYPNSDLDMVVIDYTQPQGHRRLSGLGDIYNTKKLARVISRGGFTHVMHRATASVPIVKFRDPATGLDCDLNVNDRLGIINSTLIKDYCDAHPLLRPLLYRIKDWAKPLGLNSPSPDRGPPSFSSYAFALMTISFLQKEGHLPNLQDKFLSAAKPNKDALIWTRKPHKGWDVRFRSAKRWVPPPLPDLDTLLLSWFSFWINFPYETEIISVRHGGTTPRPTSPKSKSRKPKPISNTVPICVRDPFILTKNVTAAISKKIFVSFITECQKSAPNSLACLGSGPPKTEALIAEPASETIHEIGRDTVALDVSSLDCEAKTEALIAEPASETIHEIRRDTVALDVPSLACEGSGPPQTEALIAEPASETIHEIRRDTVALEVPSLDCEAKTEAFIAEPASETIRRDTVGLPVDVPSLP